MTQQQDELEAWLAQEWQVQARLDAGAGAGVVRPDMMAGRSGLEMMQAMLRGELPYAPIAKTLDFVLLEVDEGRALFQGTPGPDHFNPMGGIHGGWYATLLDSALGCAVHTRMPPRRACTGPMARCTRMPPPPAWCSSCRRNAERGRPALEADLALRRPGRACVPRTRSC